MGKPECPKCHHTRPHPDKIGIGPTCDVTVYDDGPGHDWWNNPSKKCGCTYKNMWLLRVQKYINVDVL